MVEEAFLDNRGTFEQPLELEGDTDNHFRLTILDQAARGLARVPWCVRHHSGGRPLGQGVLPTQLITKPLQIQVLNRARQCVKHVIAPVGANLPGMFACTCHTVDQSGRIVVPIYEENRLIKQLTIEPVDVDLPVGSPVDVEFQIDVKHTIEVRVKLRRSATGGESVTTAVITPPPPPGRPTLAELEEIRQEIERLVRDFSGSYRTRVTALARRLSEDLREALTYDDEPKAIQRMAELRDLLQQLQVNRTQILDPPWARFAQLVKHCLHRAAEVGDRTGRDRKELFEQVYAQERYAEQAYEEKNQTLYRECFDNLDQLAGYLDRLLTNALPRGRRPSSAAEDARDAAAHLRNYLAAVAEKARARGRTDLQDRLARLAEQGSMLAGRIDLEPVGVIREARRLLTEVEKIEEELTGRRRGAGQDGSGLLGH
jgi:hypothetical protein